MSLAEDEVGNIATEFRYACWAQRHPPSCALLADFVAVSREDMYRSRDISIHACNGLRFGPSCYQVGIDVIFSNTNIFTGKPTGPDYAQAFSYFTRGCEIGHAKSCYRKGQMMIEPKGKFKGVKSNVVDGLATLERACDKGCFEACHEASVHLLSGKLPGVAADYRRAFTLTKTACEFGLLDKACHNLAAMYENGVATKKDPQVAKKVREKMASRPPS